MILLSSNVDNVNVSCSGLPSVLQRCTDWTPTSRTDHLRSKKLFEYFRSSKHGPTTKQPQTKTWIITQNYNWNTTMSGKIGTISTITFNTKSYYIWVPTKSNHNESSKHNKINNTKALRVRWQDCLKDFLQEITKSEQNKLRATKKRKKKHTH